MKKNIKLILTTTLIALFMPVNNNKSFAQYFSHNFGSSFDGGFNFDYGSWQNNTSVGTNYAEVSPAPTTDDSGGAGVNIGTPITFPIANAYIKISIKLLPGHDTTNSDIRVTLSVDSNNFAVWNAPVTAFNTANFTDYLVPISNPPVFSMGTAWHDAPTFATSTNFTGISSVQVQGTFAGMNYPYEFQIQSISIIPEPGTVALLATTVLLSGIVVARQRMNKFINKTLTA
jgi:hypothetical protein